jgi:hypothetical protein
MAETTDNRPLSQTPSAQRSRERRLTAMIKKEESEFMAEVRSYMDKGMSFDDAWIAAGGGTIIPCKVYGYRDPRPREDQAP